MVMRLFILILIVFINCHVKANAMPVEIIVSPGGIKAWVIRDRSVPLIAIRFIFRGSGAVSDPIGKFGRANMASALLDEGAGTLGSQDFQREVQDRSILLSFNVGKDILGGTVKVLNRYRKKGLELTRLAIGAPRFDQAAIRRIRAQILTSLKARSSQPDYIAGREWARIMYGDHVYSQPVIGTQESLANINRLDLQSFVKENLTLDRLIISIVGDIDLEEAKLLLDEMFANLPKKGRQTIVKKAQVPSEGKVYVFTKTVPQSVVLFGHQGVARKNPNFFTAYIINHILGGGSFTSRLYNSVREQRGLAYSVSTYLSVRPNAPLIIGQLSTSNDKVAETLKVVRSEWQKMARYGVNKETLANSKKFINGSFALQFSSSNKIANLLTMLQYYGLSPSYLREREKYINSVTHYDIKKYAEEFLRPDALTVVVVGQPTDLTSLKWKIGSNF